MIKERLEKLRELMTKRNIQAFYVHGSDPHMSEYLPERWQTRAFISGFSGSYGWIAITLNKAALWTDSRYFLQAEEQLKGTGIKLMKARLPETPDVTDWLLDELHAGDRLGFHSECFPLSLHDEMQNKLSSQQIEISNAGDLLDEIWDERPAIPLNKIFEHEEKYTGETRLSKIQRIQEEMKKSNSDLHILTALDDIAWTFNLRGNDINFNPVFLSYAIISQYDAILFIKKEKLSEDLKNKLVNEGILIKEYNSILSYLNKITGNSSVHIDPGKTNFAITSAIPESCRINKEITIPALLKAQKNSTEIANIRDAMKKDGIALTEFWYWLENNLEIKKITEYTIALKLTEFRKNQALFKGDSFFPIVGYNEHGAIVHFRVDENSALEIRKEGILLIDSGAHYLDGTTDITRTIALGNPTKEQKTNFTLVLKGLISLTNAVFPEHTAGHHLDVLARKALWEYGLNYGHGTGHGVGFFLNVHEGPASIRMDFSSQTIKEGMVLSNEPGFYSEGRYGIRTENLILCTREKETEYGKFLGFDTLTLFPVDTEIIDKNLLSENEISWLNNYHQHVFNELSPYLSGELKKFLQGKTQPI